MASNKVVIRKIIKKASDFLETENELSQPATEIISLLVDAVKILSNSINLNSNNSSKPPSTDTYRPRKTRVTSGKKRKPGGLKGHKGANLEPVANPDTIEQL